MTKWRDTYSKPLTGKTWKQLTRRTTAPQVIENLIKTSQSKYPRRYIADNDQDGRIYLDENDSQESTHILGTTKQGKSKFLEMDMSMSVHMLMDKALNYKAGFCFIDSTEHGSTMYKVLKYCMKKGFEKLLLIDPHHIEHPNYGYVTPINPLDYTDSSESVAAHIADSVRVLWKTEDFNKESIITRNLKFFVELLHRGHYTMAESEELISPALSGHRLQMINQAKERTPKLNWVTEQELLRIYKTCNDKVWGDVQATLRRFDPFVHSSMKSIMGSEVGINFEKLIKEGWIILCNLHKARVYDTPQQRLLGTVIINEIIRARERMKYYPVPFHIYIDEFGFYVTEKITELLMYARHLNIYVTLAHQGFFQIDMPKVKSAVKNGCKNKFLFYTADDADLYEMIGMMYGGQISDREIKYVLDGLKKQQAALKIGKQPTRICDLRSWPDSQKTDSQVKEFILNLYKTNPQLYRPKADVWGEITNRFASSTKTQKPIRRDNLEPKKGSDTKAPKRGKRDERPAAGESDTVRGDGEEIKTDSHNAQETRGEGTENIPVSPDLRPDYSDARPFRRRRPGSEEQGS